MSSKNLVDRIKKSNSTPAADMGYSSLISHLQEVNLPLVVLDWHGHVWEANAPAYELLGIEQDQLADAVLLELVPRDERRQLLEGVRTTILGHDAQDFQGHVKRDGHQMPVRWSFRRVANEASDSGWAECAFSPVAETRNDGHQDLAEPAGDGKDAGTSIQQLVGERATLQEQLRQKTLRIQELEQERMETRASADRAVERITYLQQQLDSRVEDLRQSNAEWNALAVFVEKKLQKPTHELQYVLQKLNAEAIAEMPVQARAPLAAASAQYESQTRIFQGLWEFCHAARMQLQIEMVDMTAAFSAAANLVKQKWNTDHCVIHISKLAECEADRQMILKVAEHLLTNAVKFTAGRQNQVIEVSSWHLQKSKRQAKGGPMAWTVRDNGPGFAADSARRLFLPGGIIDPQDGARSAGLELATVRRIVQRLGGDVWAESEPGNGASFSFTIGKAGKR